MYLSIAFVTLATIERTAAFSKGAPTLACDLMRPLHISFPQNGMSPFFAHPDKVINSFLSSTSN